MLATTTEKKTMQAVLVPLVDEALGSSELLATQWFYPGGHWNRGELSLRKLGRLLTGRARIDDRLPLQSVIAVTPTRVVVYAAAVTRDGFQLGEQAREWPRDAVSGSVRTVEMSSAGGGSSRMHFRTFRRAEIQTPDGRLVADLPAHERASARVVSTLGLESRDKAKKRGQRRRRAPQPTERMPGGLAS